MLVTDYLQFAHYRGKQKENAVNALAQQIRLLRDDQRRLEMECKWQLQQVAKAPRQ